MILELTPDQKAYQQTIAAFAADACGAHGGHHR